MAQDSEREEITSKLYVAVIAVAIASFVIGVVVGYLIWGT